MLSGGVPYTERMDNPTILFPLIVTEKLDETRAYYRDVLGAETVSDMEGYFQVRFGEGESAPQLAFMGPRESKELGGRLEAFSGRGVIVSIPTPDADKHHAALRDRKARILHTPTDKPWGWRSFPVRDPSGVVLDFFHAVAQPAVADATG